jgi:Mg/Co/Ni transporter MgtE
MATDMIARALAKKASQNYNNYSNKGDFPKIGESGQLYFDTEQGLLYYWNEEKKDYNILLSVEYNEDIVTEELVSEIIQQHSSAILEEMINEKMSEMKIDDGEI